MRAFGEIFTLKPGSPWKSLGPGLLMAGIAIGVSHLVQSTRAGALFGFQLVGVIVLINVLKYPFFDYGHRYAAARGETLLHGYKRLGVVYLYTFFIFQFIAALAGVAAVTMMTAALAENLLGLGLHQTLWSALVMVACIAILLLGDYKWLDRTMKAIMSLLVVATTAAFVMALFHGPVARPDYVSPSPWNLATVGFLIALMGWMPGPIETTVYQSLWVNAQEKSNRRRTSVKDALFDFNFGYVLSLVMALMFVTLGAYVMHGSGETFADNGVEFAGQIVNLYKHTLGEWSGPIIALSAFTTMFSTTLTVIDANPRALSMCLTLSTDEGRLSERTVRWLILTLGCSLELMIIHFFGGSLKKLIDVAITVGFVLGPIFAWLNFRLITSEHTPEEHRPGPAMRLLSWCGLVFFVGFSLLFLVKKYGMS